MASGPRVVAELGRPETPEETAARKAASSAAYRQSRTFRNLIVALMVTLAVVLVVVVGVPRGEPADQGPIDPASIGMQAAQAHDRTIIVPEIPLAWTIDNDGEPIDDAWRVNSAGVEGEGGAQAFKVVYVPDATSFLTLAQGLDVSDAWARTMLRGTAPTDSVVIDGIEWDVYDIRDPASTGNLSYALGTQAGADHVLLYGTAGAQTTADLAELIADQVRVLREDV